MKVHRGKKHNYLGMHFDFLEKGKVKIDMIDYINQIVDDFSIVLGDKDTIKTPAKDNIFKVDDSEDLNKSKAEEFHTFVTK